MPYLIYGASLIRQPRHLAPQPKAPISSLRSGIDGVLDALLLSQHVLEMFRRALLNGVSRRCLDRLTNRLTNRLTKIITEAHKLSTPLEWAEIGRLCRPLFRDHFCTHLGPGP